MVCIDASVFVSSAREKELHHRGSLHFLDEVAFHNVPGYGPALVLAECAGALARRTGSEQEANGLVEALQSFPGFELIPLDLPLARRAAQIAARHRLRGADAVYAATAERQDATLITWDTEMLDRGASVVPTLTPVEWLEERQAG